MFKIVQTADVPMAQDRRGIAKCHRENRNDELPRVPKPTNLSIEAQELLGARNPGRDLRPAVSLRTMLFAILPLVLPLESPIIP